MNAAASASTSAAKDAGNFALSRNRKPSCGGRIGGTGAPGGGSLISDETDSSLSGANAAMYTSPATFGWLPASEAVRTFSALLNHIRYRGEEFVVEPAGEPVCRMTPATRAEALRLRDLASLLQEIPKPDAGYAGDIRDAARSQGPRPRSPWGR